MHPKFKIGYTTGVFDLFHIGHLNILKRAKEQCEYLIVGVSTDELVESYKHKKPVISFKDRIAIVEAIRYVDEAIPQKNMDKIKAWQLYHFDVMFVGDDWKGTDKWNKLEKDFKRNNVRIVYFQRTVGISSTILESKIM
jgi:glycerol-3-phosphate cytidylyltransferase